MQSTDEQSDKVKQLKQELKKTDAVLMLDSAKVTFWDNTFIASNCIFSTDGHPLDVQQPKFGGSVVYLITVEYYLVRRIGHDTAGN